MKNNYALKLKERMIKFMVRPYEQDRDWLDYLLDYTNDDREDEE